MTVRSVSYGGGVQSTALLVLAAQGRIDFPLFLFANVGADSEHPASLKYVRAVAMPYAEAHGIELLELCRVPRKGRHAGPCPGGGVVPALVGDDVRSTESDGAVTMRATCPSCGERLVLGSPPWRFPDHQRAETLWGRLMHPDSRSLPIPVRMSNGAPGNRSCTADFKIRVIGHELVARGATKTEPATVALGISVDEIERAKPGIDPLAEYQFRTYPLLDLGLHRSDCKRLIADAGLPVPGKSACFFCPFHDLPTWDAQARHEPELFTKAVELEATLNARRDASGKDRVYLTRYGRPLVDVIADYSAQGTLDGMDGCDSGYCMT